MQLQVLPVNKAKDIYTESSSEQNFSVPPALLEPEDAVSETEKYSKRQPEDTNARVDFGL